MAKKVLFINQEIDPYVAESHMSVMGRELPQKMQEAGFEIRTFMPKWGTINERRGQLHEVIRLSGMNLIIDDTDHPLIIMMISGWSVSSMIRFIPDRRMTSCNCPRRSLMVPHLGMKVRISKPASCIF